MSKGKIVIFLGDDGKASHVVGPENSPEMERLETLYGGGQAFRQPTVEAPARVAVPERAETPDNAAVADEVTKLLGSLVQMLGKGGSENPQAGDFDMSKLGQMFGGGHGFGRGNGEFEVPHQNQKPWDSTKWSTGVADKRTDTQKALDSEKEKLRLDRRLGILESLTSQGFADTDSWEDIQYVRQKFPGNIKIANLTKEEGGVKARLELC